MSEIITTQISILRSKFEMAMKKSGKRTQKDVIDAVIDAYIKEETK